MWQHSNKLNGRVGEYVHACARTSTQNLGPLYPVKSCTTRFALSIPLRHTDGHFAFILPRVNKGGRQKERDRKREREVE